MRFGILGGTFDPIHFGHLRTAEEVGEIFGLKKVYLIPSKNPPHKKRKKISPFSERFYMSKLAIEDSEILDVLDVEGKRQGYSYTIDTLKSITTNSYFGQKQDIFFILGLDAFMEIDTWKDYKELFHYTNFVIVKRPGYNNAKMTDILERIGMRYTREKGEESFLLHTGKRIFFISVTFMDISSSRIRELVRNGRSVSFLLPKKVKEYILRKGLYRDGCY